MLEFYQQTYPVARKEHRCEFCNKKILKGSRYSYETGKYDGDMFIRKLCPECHGILLEYGNEEGLDEFEWDWISDWLCDKYCQDCNKEECKTCPQQCDLVRSNFSSEIPEGFYRAV